MVKDIFLVLLIAHLAAVCLSPARVTLDESISAFWWSGGLSRGSPIFAPPYD